MKINIDKFSVPREKKVNLKRWPTRVKPFYDSEEDYLEFLHEHVRKLSAMQDLLYAHNRYAVLLIFQAMDAAGKDSAIKHVLSGVNPQGCQVSSFKQPSAEELEHDFLWRTTCRLPERGHIGIFNRSYYEEVLIARVHPEILRGQLLPEEAMEDRIFGSTVFNPSSTLKSICTATARAWSNFSSTFPRRSKNGASSGASTSRRRIGNSARLTFASANYGSNT
jgi:polyphosphate kinase 2 (PPK2 family)